MTHILRRLALLGIVVVALVALGSTALAAPAVKDTPAVIDEIVAQADADMDGVTARFAAAAPIAGTETELDQMEIEASAELDLIYTKAEADLDAIADQLPEAKSAVANAKASLNKLKNSYRVDVRRIGASTVFAPSNKAATTTTVAPAAPVTPGRPEDAESEDTKPEPQVADEALAPLIVFGDGEPLSERPDRPDPVFSGGLADHMSVVMPPRLAVALVSPLIVLEALARVVFDSLQALVLPTLLLLAALVFMLRWKPNEEEAV